MQRYLETLFRRKMLFLVPLIMIPLLAVTVTYFTTRQSVVRATLWVEPTQFLEVNSFGRGTSPNDTGATVLRDRLRTTAFRTNVMNRSGLTEAIISGAWPQPTRLQNFLERNDLLRVIGKLLNVSAPASEGQALSYGLKTVSNSLKVTTAGKSLIVVTYRGPDPALGQRLIEAVLALDREETLSNRNREIDIGVEFLTKSLQSQEELLTRSSAELLQFEEQFPVPPRGILRAPDELKELQRLQQIQSLDKARYLNALDRLEDLRLKSEKSISTTDLRFSLIDAPNASGGARSAINIRQMGLMGMMGITLGLSLGVTIIVVATWRDGKVRSTWDLKRISGISVIVEIPDIAIPTSQRKSVFMTIMGFTHRGQPKAADPARGV